MQALKTRRGMRASLILAAFAAVAVASAKTESHTFDTGVQTLDWSGVDFSLPRFQSSLGTLTSVSFVMTASIDADVALANTSTGNLSNKIEGTAVGHFSLYERGTGFTVVDGEVAAEKVGGVYRSGVQTPTYDGVHGAAFQGLAASKEFAFASTDQSILAYVTDGSDLLFDFDAYGDSISAIGGGNGVAHYSIDGRALGSIVYTYTPQAVPEPASMAALGLGAVGILRRRRKGGAR